MDNKETQISIILQLHKQCNQQPTYLTQIFHTVKTDYTVLKCFVINFSKLLTFRLETEIAMLQATLGRNKSSTLKEKNYIL